MNYEEFKNEFVAAVKEKLYERGSDVDIKINNVEKMNDSYEAMTVTPEGSNIDMNMNLEVFAEAYESSVPFDEIVEQVTHKVASDRNADLLAKVPHQEMEDMAVGYRFVMESNVDGRAFLHEVLSVRDDGEVNYSDLKAMIEEVNATQVAPSVARRFF